MSNRGKGGSGDASKSLSAFATKHWGDALGGSAAVGSLLAHCLTACYLCCTVAMFVGVFAQARLPPSRRRRRRRDPVRLFRALARSAGRRRLFALFLLLLLLLLATNALARVPSVASCVSSSSSESTASGRHTHSRGGVLCGVPRCCWVYVLRNCLCTTTTTYR